MTNGVREETPSAFRRVGGSSRTLVLTERVTWIDVCAIDELTLDRGACALVDDQQVALFRVAPHGALYALSNCDPFSGAHVLSRGIVGSAGDVVKVASPVYKQAFDLRTGRCLDDPSVVVPTFPVREVDGRVVVGVP